MEHTETKWEVLFEDEREFVTHKVVRIEGDYFHVIKNGGFGGAWQDRKDQVTTIALTEARRLGLEMGYKVEVVAETA